jgi:cysteine-rich repeat protein
MKAFATVTATLCIFAFLMNDGTARAGSSREELTAVPTSRTALASMRCRRLQRAVQMVVGSEGYATQRLGRHARRPRRVVRDIVGSSVRRRSVGRRCFRCISRQVRHGTAVSEQMACGAHDPCVGGGALSRGAGSCVDAVCDAHASCCRRQWDATCTSAVEPLCGETCAPCTHDVCEAGLALSPSCSSCVADVCGADPYCCDTRWGADCVAKVETICGLSCDATPTLAPTTTLAPESTVPASTTSTTVESSTTTTILAVTTVPASPSTTLDVATTTLPAPTTTLSASTTTLPAPDACMDVLDFEGYPAGMIVSDVTTEMGNHVIVRGTNPTMSAGVNAAVIFDSACSTGVCSGDDPDLGTPNGDFGGPGIGEGGRAGQPGENRRPLGSVLIVDEHLRDDNGDGLVDDPDDQAFVTVVQELDFSAFAPTMVHAVTFIDIEDNELPAGVELFDAAGTSLGRFGVPATGNDGVMRVELPPIAGVWKMTVTLRGSSAIDEIELACPATTTTTTLPATTTTLPATTTTLPVTTTTVPVTTTTLPATTTTLPVTTTTVPATTTTLAPTTTTMPPTTTTLPATTTTLPATTTTVPVTTTTLVVPTTTVPATTTTVPVTTTSTTTSTTSTTSTSTSTSTTSTTTTTLPGPTLTCALTLGVTTSNVLGALQYEVAYGQLGDFDGSGFSVSCQSKVAASSQIYDDEIARKLSQSIISQSGFATPAPLAECTFITSNPALSPQDFPITVLAASTPGLETENPTVAVTSLDCVEAVVQSDACDVTFDVDNTTDVLTALQFQVDYAGAPDGGFGAGGCTLAPAGGLVDVNDDTGLEHLTIAYADSASTFAGPAQFASCRYVSTSGAPPVAGDFAVSVIDASEGVPPSAADPQPTMSVAVSGCEKVDPVCGNGVLEDGEACDDGNFSNTDGCTTDCVSSVPSVIRAPAGNVKQSGGNVTVVEMRDSGSLP